MDPLGDTLRDLTAALSRVGIRYAIGGSLASSARSIWRTTLDVDIIAAIAPAQAQAFVQSLGKDWYADVDEVRNSLAAGRSFNVIHMRNAQKVDVFPAREPFHRAQLDRATVLPLGEGRVPCVVTTAEDILLAKLRWYRDGGEVSDRQWSDIGGILAQNPDLDWEYVNLWAARLHVTDLLARARVDAEK
ncbi:MAG: hypothetical protein NTW28_32725 [Candidatus Solibacter sp.]|nr:hypothetical protein [Candidatus Solibacter sp.]